ncbi:hypothetical protein DMJ27_24735 [Vibrio parahaemolyticus]|nr:hypothetical protein [Vibrio parahaemolyticus]
MKIEEWIKIIREIAIVIVVILIGYRIVNSEFNINLGTLSSTDIVALLLAFFAVGLSAAFYFKATDSSNQFYDNMHKFTQETSVLLGKIESRFGEQLKNIEQKSQDLKDSVERYYTANGTSSSDGLAEEKAQTEQQVKIIKQEFEGILETLFEKSKLDEKEKEAFKAALHQKERELETLQIDLGNLSNEEEKQIEKRITRHLLRVVKSEIAEGNLDEVPAMEFITNILKSGNRLFVRDLHKWGYITTRHIEEPGDITEKGEKLFMSILSQALKDA